MNTTLDAAWRFAPMQAQDAEALAALDALANAQHPNPWNEHHFADSLQCGYDCQLLRDEEGMLVGYYVAMSVLDEVHLLNLAVHPAQQGRGCGQALMLHLHMAAIRAQASCVWLEVRQSNERALRLYERLGYQCMAMRKDYYPVSGGAREGAWQMRLDLSAPLQAHKEAGDVAMG